MPCDTDSPAHEAARVWPARVSVSMTARSRLAPRASVGCCVLGRRRGAAAKHGAQALQILYVRLEDAQVRNWSHETRLLQMSARAQHRHV